MVMKRNVDRFRSVQLTALLEEGRVVALPGTRSTTATKARYAPTQQAKGNPGAQCTRYHGIAQIRVRSVFVTTE